MTHLSAPASASRSKCIRHYHGLYSRGNVRYISTSTFRSACTPAPNRSHIQSPVYRTTNPVCGKRNININVRPMNSFLFTRSFWWTSNKNTLNHPDDIWRAGDYTPANNNAGNIPSPASSVNLDTTHTVNSAASHPSPQSITSDAYQHTSPPLPTQTPSSSSTSTSIAGDTHMNYMTQQQHAQSDVLHDIESAATSVSVNPSPTSQLDYIDDRWGITQTLTNPIEKFICLVHDTTGLPWWVTIVGITVLLRTILFPLALSQVKLGARFSHAAPILKKYADEFKARQQASTGGLSMDEVNQHKARMTSVIRDYDANPLKMLRPILVFAPAFILLFSTLRHMAHTHPSMTTGGALWFKDLTALDPYWGLPVLSAISTILSIKFGAGEFATTDARTEQVKDIFVVVAAVFAIVAAYYIPSVVFLYWTANNMFTFMQGRLFASKRVRDILNIPAPRIPTAEERTEQQSKLTNLLNFGQKPQPLHEQANIVNNNPLTTQQRQSTAQKLQSEQQQLQQKIVTLYAQKPKKKKTQQQQPPLKKHISTMTHRRVYCTLASSNTCTLQSMRNAWSLS